MSKIRLFLAGDFCSTPSTRPITVSDELRRTINSCQLRLCNFEVPLKPDGVEAKPGRYYQNDDAPAFLEDLGFNLFSFANNHAMDYGVEGYEKTMQAFRNKPFGTGTYEEAYTVKEVEVDGVKIGFLPLCFAARFGVFDDCRHHEGIASAYINDLRVNHIIIEAKQRLDYLIVLPHDGIEWVDIPMPETIARYRDFIDYGADAVIAAHPHCPQGWEEYKEKPVFYSLGNFLFNSKSNYDYRAWNRAHWYEGLCVLLTIDTETHGISCQAINTRNVDNLGIVIDNDPKRDEHNRRLCQYLSDRQAYDECLNTEVRRVVESEYMPLVDTKFSCRTLRRDIKAMIKSAMGKYSKSYFPIYRMLKHDAMRVALIRRLKEHK